MITYGTNQPGVHKFRRHTSPTATPTDTFTYPMSTMHATVHFFDGPTVRYKLYATCDTVAEAFKIVEQLKPAHWTFFTDVGGSLPGRLGVYYRPKHIPLIDRLLRRWI